MPTYTTIPDSTIAPEAPVTSELMTLLRDNPIAVAEGDGTAPKIKARALDIRNASSTSSPLTATNLADLNYVMITGFVSTTYEETVSVQYRLSTDGGSNWGSYTVVAAIEKNTADSSPHLAVCYVVDVSGSTNAIEIIGPSGSGREFDITLLNIG